MERIWLLAPGATITFAPELSGETIRLSGGELSIDKSLIIDASALVAGVILSEDADGSGSPTPGDSRVLKIEPGGHTVELRRLTITQGVAPEEILNEVGGGIFNDEGNLTLRECTVSHCRSDADPFFASGGGIYSQLGSLVLVASTIAHDQAPSGGGLVQFGGFLEITNCTIAHNRAEAEDAGFGGGLYNLEGPVTIASSTISANQSNRGGGLFNADTVNAVLLRNSILAGNRANQSDDGIRGRFQGDSAAPSNIGGDPLLHPLGSYGGPTQVMPPMAGSPAINAGLSASVATDQRGVPRPQGSGLDNGAVEVADTGYGPAQLRLTYHSFDPGTRTVVLRWKQLRGPYSVNSSADLNFGEAHDDTIAVDNVNGLTDEVTWPGEIQFAFVDPLATGDLHFWRVIAE